MFNNLTKFILVLALTFTISVRADDTRHLDNTVAAGIVFKLGYLLQSEGTWSDRDSYNPQVFNKAMESIAKDLSNLSTTDRGITLKKEGHQLISFLTKGILLSSEPVGDELKNFLKDLGLDPASTDPEKLAQIFSQRIAEYAKLTNTPDWVYSPKKREIPKK